MESYFLTFIRHILNIEEPQKKGATGWLLGPTEAVGFRPMDSWRREVIFLQSVNFRLLLTNSLSASTNCYFPIWHLSCSSFIFQVYFEFSIVCEAMFQQKIEMVYSVLGQQKEHSCSKLMEESRVMHRLDFYRMAGNEQILGFNSRFNTGKCHWPSWAPACQ